MLTLATTGIIALIIVAAVLAIVFVGLPKAESPSSLASAEAALERGDFGFAEAQARQVLADHPDDMNAAHLLARALRALGKNDEALEQYGVVTRRDTTDDSALFELAVLERTMGMTSDSETHLTEAISRKPGNCRYTDELARTKMARGSFEEAARLWGSLLKAASSNDDRKQYLVLQAQAYRAAKDYSSAEAAYRSALELDPADRALNEVVASFN